MAINPSDYERLERQVTEWAHLSGLPLPAFDKKWNPVERDQVYKSFIAGELRMRRRLEHEQDQKKRQALEAQVDPSWLETAQRTIFEHNDELAEKG
jgi:hypothetical protein